MYSQTAKLSITKLQAVNVSISFAKIMDMETIRVIKDPAVKETELWDDAELMGITGNSGDSRRHFVSPKL